MRSAQTTWKVKSKLFVCRCNEHDPIYLCGSCSLRVAEQDVLSHVTSLGHKKMHQVVVEVNENVYDNISKQSFHPVDSLNLLQQTSERREPLPTSAPSPVKAPAAFKKRVTFVMENNKVIRIDPEDHGTAMPEPICEKPIHPILKWPSAPPVGFTTAEKPATSSTRTPISSKSAVKSAVVSRPVGRSQTVPPGKTFNATFNANVTCSSAPFSKMKTVPTCAEATPKALVTPWIKSTSVATVKPQTKQKITGASKLAHAKKSLGESPTVAVNLGINSAPHLPTAMSEEKNPRKEPSPKSANKTALNGNFSKVGLNQLMIVSCKGKKQVYCLLCAARLRSSSHASSYNHCYKYVKMKYPELTARPLEKKLSSIVAHLAEVERDVGFQTPQRMEVTEDMYHKLAELAEDTAVEMVKTMLRQKDPRVSSVKDDTVLPLFLNLQQLQVSSSDDGVSVVDDKVSGVLSDQTQQEPKQCQTKQIHFPGEDVAVERRSVKSSEEDKSDDQDKLQESICYKAHPDPVPGSQAEKIKEVILENVQEDKTDPDAAVNSMREITHESSGTKVLKPLCETGDPHSPVGISFLQEAVSSPLKPSLVQICSPPLETPASVATGPQEQGRAAALGECSASQTQPLQFFGARAQGCSHLLCSLNVSQSWKSVIGMASVWECQGISQEMFYLCESCEMMLPHRDILQHMVSLQHQLKYLWSHHPQFLQLFWLKEDLPAAFKTNVLNDIVQQLAFRERFHEVDAQCVFLELEIYWFVRMTDFSEALKVVKIITNKEQCEGLLLRVNALLQKGQQNDYLRIGKPLSTKSVLASTLNTKHRRDFETEQNATKTGELMSVVEDPYTVRKREVLSPDGRYFPVKNEAYASPIPVHPNPHKTSQSSSPQPTLAPDLSHLQSSYLLSESPSTSAVSLTHKSPGIRKRAAETSIQTLLLSSTSSPLEHPLPDKCARSPVRVKTEPQPPSASVSLKDIAPAPKQAPHTVDRSLFSELISELNISSEIVDFNLPSASAAVSPGNIQTRWDSRVVVIKYPTAVLKRKWDSRCQLVKATVKKNLPINFVEGFKTELTTDVNSVSGSASCSGSYSASSAAAVQSASTAASADPKDPHTLQSANN